MKKKQLQSLMEQQLEFLEGLQDSYQITESELKQLEELKKQLKK